MKVKDRWSLQWQLIDSHLCVVHLHIALTMWLLVVLGKHLRKCKPIMLSVNLLFWCSLFLKSTQMSNTVFLFSYFNSWPNNNNNKTHSWRQKVLCDVSQQKWKQVSPNKNTCELNLNLRWTEPQTILSRYYWKAVVFVCAFQSTQVDKLPLLKYHA